MLEKQYEKEKAYLISTKKEFFQEFKNLSQKDYLRLFLIIAFGLFILISNIMYKRGYLSENFMWDFYGPIVFLGFLITTIYIFKKSKISWFQKLIFFIMDTSLLYGAILSYSHYRFGIISEDVFVQHIPEAGILFIVGILLFWSMAISNEVKKRKAKIQR